MSTSCFPFNLAMIARDASVVIGEVARGRFANGLAEHRREAAGTLVAEVEGDALDCLSGA